MGARLLKSSISTSSVIIWPTKSKLCRIIVVIGAQIGSVPDCDFLPGGALLEISNRSTVYSSHARELKLGRMILDVSPHNRSTSDFSILSRGAWGARLSKSSNRFTAYSSGAIELKFGRMILDISPHNGSTSEFPILSRGRAY